MTAPVFLAPAERLGADRVVLDGAEGHHAADVRRLRRGETVTVADGAGSWVRGPVAEVARGRVVVAVEERGAAAAPSPRLVVVQALAKGGRDLDALEAMTEVGVDAVAGWQAGRSVARWTDRTSARWAGTVREAAKQARRVWVPEVSGPLTTARVSELLEAAALAVVLHEEASEPLAALTVPAVGDVVVVVGPEGGVAPEELATFASAGAHVCRLGGTVLRTSTAGARRRRP